MHRQILSRRPSRSFLTAISGVGTLLLITLQASRHNFTSTSLSLHRTGSFDSRDALEDIYNNTFGFEKIFVVGLPSRTDRRDGMILGASLSNLEIEFIDGVPGETVIDKAIPTSPQHERLPNPTIGFWRAHINAIQEVVRRNLSTALIFEDDADWDIRIRDQLRDFALSARALTQPLLHSPGSFADPTYPAPADDSAATAPDIPFESPSATVSPHFSPYGDNWDLLWLGHCGMRFPFPQNKRTPKGRVVQNDFTVPQQQYLWTISVPDDLKVQYPNHTRVVHHLQEGVCSLGYAITQKGARQLLYEVGLKDLNSAFDLLLRQFCEGTDGKRHHRCLTVQPSLFHHHRPVGPKNAESDISDHGDGWRETAHTNVVRWSVRMNAEILMEGQTDFVDQWPDV